MPYTDQDESDLREIANANKRRPIRGASGDKFADTAWQRQFGSQQRNDAPAAPAPKSPSFLESIKDFLSPAKRLKKAGEE
jgi:hypothetical protein